VDLTTRPDAVRFCGYAVVVGPIAGGLIGATVKSVDQGTPWFTDLVHWWAGDGLAVLAIGAPLILFVVRPTKLRLFRQFDGALVLALSLAASFAAFGGWRIPPALVVIPVMIFAALRLGVYGVSATGLVTAAIANYATAHGNGPFSEFDLSPSQELAVTQLLLAVTILTGWFLAMAVEERTAAVAGQRVAERDRAETEVMYERARRREALAERLTAAHDFDQFLDVLSRSASQIGATSVRAYAPDRAEAAASASLRARNGSADLAVVPLRGASGNVEAIVELTWDPPESEANARDAFATLVAVSGPTLVRVGVDAQMDARRKRSDLRYEFGAALATAVTARQTAQVIAQFATRTFGASGAAVVRLNLREDSVDVLGETGLCADLAHEIGRLEGFGPATEAIRDHVLVVVPDRATIADRYPMRSDLLDEPDLAAVAAVPFVAGDETIGAVRLHFRPGELDRDVIEQQWRGFADQAAQALERARLADNQRDALQQANVVRDAVGTLATAVTEGDVADAVVELGFPALRCEAGALVLCDEANPEVVRVSRIAGFDEEGMEQYTRVGGDAGTVTPGRAALLTGRPVYIRDEHELAEQYPESVEIYKRHGIAASANLPLLEGRRQFGALSLSYHGRQEFSDPERYVLETYAQYVADAILRTRATSLEHEIVANLQHTMLPARTPELAAARVATRYRPASIGLPVGGDWYDIIAITPTTTAFVVGDVLGKGPAASASMGQLRTAVRTAAAGSTPPEVLAALDRLAEDYDEHFEESMATIAYVVFDAVQRTITYCSAGHCPAALVDGDGAITWLPSNGPPVGAKLDGTRSARTVSIAEKARIVLYTDGLIERREESLDVGLDRLEAVLACHPGDGVDLTAESLLRDLASASMQRDDIALLVADLQTVPDEFHEQVSARLDELRPLRARLRAWLDDSFIESEVAEELAIAINEVVTNAIEHGSSDSSATVAVVARRTDDRVEIEISDPGTPRVGVNDPDRGRGFPIMHALMDDVTFTPSLVGTTVRMHRLLPRR
jgi:anti-sigma regulatory factor (Ser/Thr protein kinase)/transcriptional regulator with GAF, ATPase, and Fis domain